MAIITETTSIQIETIPQLRKDLGAPNNPYLFPEHYLKATLPKIGGKVEIHPDGSIGFFFPSPGGGITRLHRGVDMTYEPGGISPSDFVYSESHFQIGGLDIGHPNKSEADAIRQLQKTIWNTTVDRLYPVDIHSDQFGISTSLVARAKGQVMGFVFGFWRQNQTDWQIESQLAGVLEEHRKSGIAFHLKIEQAVLAMKLGVRVITWTADPLQLANCMLNLNKLGAKATKFYPDLYSFAGANVLNQTPASRFEFRWELNSPTVVEVISARQPRISHSLRLEDYSDIAVVSKSSGIPQSHYLAIPVPSNWTEMQKDKEAALRLRSETDTIFRQIIGPYAVVAVVFDNNQIPYLIAEKNDD